MDTPGGGIPTRSSGDINPTKLSLSLPKQSLPMSLPVRLAAVICSARALSAPARLHSATRLMASAASGAPPDETRGGTASLADQIARVKFSVRTLYAH